MTIILAFIFTSSIISLLRQEIYAQASCIFAHNMITYEQLGKFTFAEICKTSLLKTKNLRNKEKDNNLRVR